jgi:DNA-binding transcriptional ArsR family regulator
MKSSSNLLPERIFKVLQDETRLAIYICLTIYTKLTVKQLSEFRNKGKTTINHHLRKLDEAGVVIWKIKEDDMKKLKTRYFSIDQGLIGKFDLPSKEDMIDKEELIYGLMRTEALVTTNLMNWMIKYIEEQRKSIDPQVEFFIKTVNLTPETLNVYKEKQEDLIQTITKTELNDLPTTHISTHVLIPIKDVLEWRKRSKELGE